MKTDLAAKLVPYLSYFLYAQLILVCMLVLFGGVMLLKRIRSKANFAPGAMDSERVAAELNSEISRLRDLRNRLYPAGADEDSDEDFHKEPRSGGGDTVDRAEIEKSVEARFQLQIEELQKKINAEGPAHTGDAAKDIEHLQNQVRDWEVRYEALKKEKPAPQVAEASDSDLKAKVAVLESALTEYELFEEEFSMVKQYKVEIENLRAQLEGKGMPAISIKEQYVAQTAPAAPEISAPEITPISPVEAASIADAIVEGVAETTPKSSTMSQDDIEALFADLDSGLDTAAVLAEHTPSVAPPVAPVEINSTPAASSEPFNMEAELEAMLASSELMAPVESVPPPEETIAAAAPIIDRSPSVMELAAEAAVEFEGEDMVAEFEKLLGPKA